MPSGDARLGDGFANFNGSGFVFSSASVTPWNSSGGGVDPDIAGANPAKQEECVFFCQFEQAPYPDKGARGGMVPDVATVISPSHGIDIAPALDRAAFNDK